MDAPPNHRILVVDDDPLIRRALTRLLQPMGFEVEVAACGAEAVARFQAQSCAVVITDYYLPDIDGLSLADKLVALEPSTSFVVVTSQALLSEATSDLGKSIVSFIAKPWDQEELLDAVRRAGSLQSERAAGTADLALENTLLIEDNDGDALLVEELLGQGADGVRRVQQLRDGLDLLRGNTYQVVIADLSLPDARGLDCVAQIVRASPGSATIVFSGVEDTALALEALRIGAEDYLIKGRTTASELQRAIRFAVARREADRRVSQLAHTDALTGLFNRAAFMDRLRRALAQARRGDRSIWVLYMDLDRFKIINDTLGHAIGDAVLQEFAQRLVSAVRPYDSVGRLGGDEFAILLEDVACPEDVEHVARRVLDGMAEPIVTDKGPLQVGTSIGISTRSRCEQSPETLLSAADAAMYSAKRLGSNRFCRAGGSAT